MNYSDFFKYIHLFIDFLTIFFLINNIFLQITISYYLIKINKGITEDEYDKLKHMILSNFINLIILFISLILQYFHNIYKIKLIKNIFFLIVIFYIFSFYMNIYIFYYFYKKTYLDNNKLWKYKDNIKFSYNIYILSLLTLCVNILSLFNSYYERYLKYLIIKIKEYTKYNLNKLYKEYSIINNGISLKNFKKMFKTIN